jgi:cell division protease FtsH
MAATLGGRAAEEIINNKISSGALSDLEKITKQAYAMVSYLGMSKEIGNVSFYDSTESGGFNIGKPYSEKTAELIDAEVKRFVDEAYVLAKKVLNENLDGFTQLAEKLLEKEVIFAEDLEKIFGKRAGSQPPTITEQIEKAIENPEGKQETIEEKEQNPEEKTENE